MLIHIYDGLLLILTIMLNFVNKNLIMMNPNRSFFLNRRSIRRYDSGRDVDSNLLKDLLEAARMAPNTGNMQLYSVVVTTNPDRIAELAAKGHFNQPAASGAKALLTFCIDMHRFSLWCRAHGAESGLNNLQGFTWATMDATIFAQQFVTLAEMEGLGTCYLGTTTYNSRAIADLLNLPSGVIPIITVSVGWPAEEGNPKQRLPFEAIVYDEEYRDPSESEVMAIYKDTEEAPESRRFVEENAKPSLAHVFTEVRYPKEGAESFSRVFSEHLSSSGIDF